LHAPQPVPVPVPIPVSVPEPASAIATCFWEGQLLDLLLLSPLFYMPSQWVFLFYRIL